MKAAETSWSTYRQKKFSAPLDIRCYVAEGESKMCFDPPTFRSQGHLLSIVVNNENFACLDLERGMSFAWVNEATVANQEYFRQCFLDVMIYPLLEIAHLVTLHAAWNVQGKGISARG